MAMQLLDQIVINPGEREIRSSAIDNIHGYGYFVVGSWDGVIIKVDLNTFTRVSTLTLGAGPGTGFSTYETIDEERGYLYVIGFPGGGNPDLLHRIRLSNFQLDQTLVLPRSAIVPVLIDKTNQKLYLTDGSNHPYMLKVDLVNFSVENSLYINEGMEYDFVFPWSGAIDVTNQLLYLSSDQEPGKIAKFDLNTFTKIGVLALNPEDVYFEQAIFDPLSQFLYVGINRFGQSCKIARIDTANLALIDYITLEPEAQWITTFQPQNIINGFGFIVVQWVSPYRIVKFSTNPFQEVESFIITGGDDYPQNIIFDKNGYGYIGTKISSGGISPARIIRIYDGDILLPTTCPTTPKYSGDIVALKATPKDGIGPYYVVFRKNGVTIDPSRLGGLPNPITNATEGAQIIRVYTLNDADIASSVGTINFSVHISDSCPTGAKTCDDTCTINIGCVAPVCNFIVT